MCERILRNASFDHEGTILRDCQELFTEPELSSGADPVLFRSLTSGELKLAQTLFKNIINYDRVKIYCDHNHSRYQSKVITNTRNGEILLSINEYKSTRWDSYHLDEPHFIFYSMEQQAAMIADYWLLKKHDFMEYEKLSSYKKYEQFNFNIRKELLGKYQSILWAHIQTRESFW